MSAIPIAESDGYPIDATIPSGIKIIPKDAKPEDRPDAKRPALARMIPRWEIPDLLLSGTAGMQEAGERVLMKEQDEKEEEYKRRIGRTVLTNYYGDTIDKHSGLPFGVPIEFEPALPERMRYLESDADGCGRSLTVFTRDLLKDAMHRGLAHVLVDVPPGPSDSYADVLRRRPRLAHIEAPALLGVRDEPSTDGQERVSYARFMQKVTEPVGNFGEKVSSIVKEIAAGSGSGIGTVTDYRVRDDGSWISDGGRPYTRKYVPLFTLYTKQLGEFEGEPAYDYLAQLNLAHFQSDADQRHGLSYGRRATLVKTGWKEGATAAEAAAKGVSKKERSVLGYSRQIQTSGEAAKAYFLETSGAPLAAGQVDLKALEERMERFGAQQVSQGGGITATSRVLDNERDTSNLQAWCTRAENVVLQAIMAVAEWLQIKLPADQKVKIDRSFAEDGPTNADVPYLIQMAEKSYLSVPTLLREMKARNVLVTVDDVEEEAQAAADAAEQNQLVQFERLAADIKAQRMPGDPMPPGTPMPGDPGAAAGDQAAA